MIINQIASGGKSEGTNAYLVKQLSPVNYGSTIFEFRDTTRLTYTFYDSIAVSNYGNLVPEGASTKYTGREINDMSTSQRNALIGKYLCSVTGNYTYFYRISKLQVSSDDDGSYIRAGSLKQDVQETIVKHGVNDDASIYASLTKCPDGYWRING